MADLTPRPRTRRSRTTHSRTPTIGTLAAIVAGLSLLPPLVGDVAVRAKGQTPSPVVTAFDRGPARLAMLAAADFDEDGVPDLLHAIATGNGGVISLYRGNIDALYPNTPEARARRSAGVSNTTPFLPGARSFVVPTAPNFLQTGDFDADGHFDAIAATSGGGAVVLRGDGAGTLGPAEPVTLPGAVTAMAVGDINGPDGLADVVFGVMTSIGSRLLVFAGHEGAWRSSPTAFELPAPAVAVVLGALDQEHESDVAVTTGQELVVFHGRPRRSAAERAPVGPAPVERRPLPQVPDSILGGRIGRESGGGVAATLRMRLDADGRDDLVAMRPGNSTPTVITTPAATGHVVVNTNDTGPGSLRAAILAANATEGDDLITFNIPGPGPHEIVPVTPLPPVVPDVRGTEGAVIIDGTSEPDFAGTPVVVLSGALVGTSGNGLTIATPSCVVRGLVINRFAVGILFTVTVEGSPGAQGGIVEGNYIGTDATGTVALGNGQGVGLGIGAVADAVFQVTVGGTVAAARNVIAGNGLGVLVTNGGHVIQGNFIGTDASGTRPLGNTTRGLQLFSADGAEIGGSAAGARNIISANADDGVQVNESGNILIRANYIGTDVSGSVALGNGSDGIDTPDSAMTIADNVISSNTLQGIFAPSIQSRPDIIDNRIGTNSAGTAALGNGQSGIDANGDGYEIRDNVVSGNGAHGIILHGFADPVQGNRIGTDITGTVALGNRGDGIRVGDLANTIGGDGAGNVIAFNGGGGVVIDLDFTTFVPILSNSIHSNGGLGIDLGNDGVTPNDACDPENEGVNDFPNFPVLTAVTASALSATVTGQLNSLPNASFLLQFFASEEPDSSGFGEGQRLLGSATVTTDATCNASFSVTLSTLIPANHVVTATATFTNEMGQVSTSEFSNAVPFVPQTSEEAILALMAQVQELVDNGDLTPQAGHVLTLRLRSALSFVEAGKPKQAAQQLRVFVQQVKVLVRTGRLDPSLKQALVDPAMAIIGNLEAS